MSMCVCVCMFFLFCLIFNQHLHVGPIHTWGWMEVSQRRAHSQLEKRKFQNKTQKLSIENTFAFSAICGCRFGCGNGCGCGCVVLFLLGGGGFDTIITSRKLLIDRALHLQISRTHINFQKLFENRQRHVSAVVIRI